LATFLLKFGRVSSPFLTFLALNLCGCPLPNMTWTASWHMFTAEFPKGMSLGPTRLGTSLASLFAPLSLVFF
jgi:hypothetical protein